MIYHAIHVFVSYKRVFEQLMCKVFYIKAIKRGRAFWNWKTRLVFIIREWFDGKFFAYYCRFNCGLGFSWWWTNTKFDGSSCLFERSLYEKNVLETFNLEFEMLYVNYLSLFILKRNMHNFLIESIYVILAGSASNNLMPKIKNSWASKYV